MKKRIMIVDDSPITSKQLRTLFESAGHEVPQTASTGMDAIQIYEANAESIDVVTLDITMPTMPGTRVLEHIMRINPNANVVMVSAVGKESVMKDCLQKGAKYFIVKPFQRDKVLEIIRRLP